MTNYEYLKNNKDAMVRLISGMDSWITIIERDYCDRICPHRNESECLCGEECDAPYLTKMAEEWLDLERRENVEEVKI